MVPEIHSSKTKKVPEILKLLEKPGTIDPSESFKLLQEQDKDSPRFFQTTLNTKHNKFRNSFQLFQKLETSGSRDP